MPIPLLDLKAQLDALRPELLQALTEVLDSTQYIMGEKVKELEHKLAEYCEVGYAIGVSSGTDALLMALMALDVEVGDLIITTPYSFFATAGVIARLKATPVLVDIEARTFNLSPEHLREWFKHHPNQIKKVKAILPVHLFGQCADMDPILAIARQYDIAVIEDAAQAIGARYPSRTGVHRAGSLGLLGCFSFFPSKNLGAIGDGGLVVTSDSALAEKLTKLRNHGSYPKYYHSLIGGNFRLDAIQAAVLLVKLPYLDSWHSARQQHAAYYDRAFANTIVQPPYLAYPRECHIYNQYVTTIPERRDDLRRYLQDNQIGQEVYYPLSFHEQPCFRYLGYRRGDFPASEYAAAHSLALPIYPELTEAMQGEVVEKILKFY